MAFAQSRGAASVALAWGFAEATLFFVVPDVWIGLLALFSWRAGVRAVVLATVGALMGGTLMSVVGEQMNRDQSTLLLEAVPAISFQMIERVEDEMRERGPASMLQGPPQGTPYKIYAVAAGSQEQPLVAFLLWTVPARGARFLLVAAIAVLYGTLIRRVTPRTDWLVAPYLFAWVIFYAAYFRIFGF